MHNQTAPIQARKGADSIKKIDKTAIDKEL